MNNSDSSLPRKKSQTEILRGMIQAIDSALPPSKRRTATRRAADTVDPRRTPDGSYYMQPPPGAGFTPAKQDLYDRQLREAGQAMRNRHAVR